MGYTFLFLSLSLSLSRFHAMIYDPENACNVPMLDSLNHKQFMKLPLSSWKCVCPSTLHHGRDWEYDAVTCSLQSAQCSAHNIIAFSNKWRRERKLISLRAHKTELITPINFKEHVKRYTQLAGIVTLRKWCVGAHAHVFISFWFLGTSTITN